MKTYIYLLALILVFFVYTYITTTKIIYDFKIYNIKNERKALITANKNIINIIEYINNTKYIVKKKLTYLLPDILINYKNNYSRTKKACEYEYAQLNFNKLKKILNKYLIELNIIEKDMYIKSNNSTLTSCQVLDKDMFNKAFKIINNINFLFNNTISNYFFTHTIQYYEFLYDKYVLLYRYINKHNIIKIGKIDTILISNHHEACEWVFKKYKNDKIPTIFHVDSHPDTNSCYNPKDLMYIKNNIHNNDCINKLYNDVLDNDIGSVIVPCLYPYKYNGGFYWLLPNWINLPKNADKGAIMFEVIENNSLNIQWSDLHDTRPIESNIIKKIKTNAGYIKDFYKFFNNIENNYILNIDLDYFVTSGEDNVKFDNVSYNRTSIDNQRIKKDGFYNIQKNKELSNELDIIRKRIDEFLFLIKYLRDLNKKPSLIILCNSSQHNINLFKEPWFNTELGIYNIMDEKNEYTPKYLSMWLQYTLIMHLKEIF